VADGGNYDKKVCIGNQRQTRGNGGILESGFF